MCIYRKLSAFSPLWRYISFFTRPSPDFLIIGANKCGTTTLDKYLRKHPDINCAYKKEVHFFDRPSNFNKGFFWYRSQFPIRRMAIYTDLGKPQTIAGEASPEYLFHPLVPQRVEKHLPSVKLIVMLRNPVDRAYSHYQMTCRNGNEKLSFSEAVSAETKRIGTILERMRTEEDFHDIAYERYSYLSRGLYFEQLQNWMKFFPREQFLVIKSENFFNNPSDTLEKVLDFLGVAQWAPKELRVSHSGKYKETMDVRLQAELNEFFAPHNQRLCELLEADFSWT